MVFKQRGRFFGDEKTTGRFGLFKRLELDVHWRGIVPLPPILPLEKKAFTSNTLGVLSSFRAPFMENFGRRLCWIIATTSVSGVPLQGPLKGICFSLVSWTLQEVALASP